MPQQSVIELFNKGFIEGRSRAENVADYFPHTHAHTPQVQSAI